MPSLDPEIRIAALEAMMARLLLAEARRHPDPAGMLDEFAGNMRRHAESLETDRPDGELDRMALAAALLQFVAEAKERLISQAMPGG